MLSFYEIYQLREKKDHLIDKASWAPELKQKAKEFFNKHPNYENKVDWNNIKDMSWGNIQLIMNQAEDSSTKKKSAYKSGDLTKLWSNWVKKDEAKIWYSDANIIFVSPLSWECAKFMDSKNCYGTGAKWCIGWEKSPQHWNEYVFDNDNQFIMVYDNIIKDKWMIQIEHTAYIIWNALDQASMNDFGTLLEVAIEYDWNISKEECNSLDEIIKDNIKDIFSNLERPNIFDPEEYKDEIVEKMYLGILKKEIDPLDLENFITEMLLDYKGEMESDTYDLMDTAASWALEVLDDVRDNMFIKYRQNGVFPESEDFMIRIYIAKYDEDEGEAIFRSDLAMTKRDMEKRKGQQFLFEKIYNETKYI